MIEILGEPFFLRILLVGLLVSVTCGVVGTWIVVMRMSSISGAVSHAAFGGVGLGYLLGWNPMLAAALFALASGLGIGIAYRRFRSSLDSLMSILWPVGMALGILFVALTPGYAPDLTSYLFGSMLYVPWAWVALVGALDLLVVGIVLLFFREFQAVAFDEEFAEVAGIHVDRAILLLLAMAALCVVTLIRVVGVILAMALLTLPAEIARRWTETLPSMMILATFVGAACTVGGLLVSYVLSARYGLSLPPGPIIILCSAGLYLFSALRSSPR
jgi:zinc transport system permease protein